MHVAPRPATWSSRSMTPSRSPPKVPTCRQKMIAFLNQRSLLGASRTALRLDRELGELELGPAAGAQRVVELDDLPAGRALAPQLVALVAIQQRGEDPDQREHGADHEPDRKPRALRPADVARPHARHQADGDVLHAAQSRCASVVDALE